MEKKKDITKRETPFYSTLKSLLNERIFGMTYFSGYVHFKTCQKTRKTTATKTGTYTRE